MSKKKGCHSIIPIIFVASTVGIYPIQIGGLQNIKVYIIAIVTIVITTAIITKKKNQQDIKRVKIC